MLSSSATTILDVLSKVSSKNASSPLGMIQEFNKLLPFMMETYRGIVSNVSDVIGYPTCSATNAMKELEWSIKQYNTAFLKVDEGGLRKEINYEPVMKS